MHRLIPASTYSRNVLILITGTSLAQVIPIAVSPILTRLYSPDQFGVFAIYIAMISIVGVIITGRYEQAIHLPSKESDAFHVTALSIGISIALSAILMILILIFSELIIKWIGGAALRPWLYLIPVSTLMIGVYQALSYWSNRKSKYKRLAISRTAQSGSSTLAQLGIGYAGGGMIGLQSGQIIGQIIATNVLIRQIWCEEKNTILILKYPKMLALAKKYINFPKYLIAAACLNTAANQLPILLFATFYNISVVGYLSLTQRVMAAPLSLISNAIGDVFRQEASHAYIANKNCKEIYLKTLKRLILISFIPFLVFFFMAPRLFSIFFGENWRVAGVYAQILLPMAFLQFIVIPLSSMFSIAQKAKLDLLWQIFFFGVVTISLLIGRIFSSEMEALKLFSAACCVAYFINGILTYRFAINKK